MTTRASGKAAKKATSKKVAAKKEVKPRGRPSVFTPEIAALIYSDLAEGKSLRNTCAPSDMPAESTVRAWALDDVEGFAAQYARAREIGYEKRAEEILQIADTPLIGVKTKTNEKGEVERVEGDMIEHRRLQVDARKWMLSKMLPKVYGDKLAVGGASDLGPLVVEITRFGAGQ